MQWRGSCAIHGWVSSSSSTCPMCALQAENQRLRDALEKASALTPAAISVADRLRADSRRLEALLDVVRQMREPLKVALLQARPVGEAPPNVEVYWRTGSNEVAKLLAMLDGRTQIDEVLGEEEPDDEGEDRNGGAE